MLKYRFYLNILFEEDIMKHSFSRLFFVLFVVLFSNCFADCSDCEARFIACPKTYVQPSQVYLYENAIIVQVQDMTMQAESLQSDDHGLFFDKVRDKDCGFGQWRCNNSIGRDRFYQRFQRYGRLWNRRKPIRPRLCRFGI